MYERGGSCGRLHRCRRSSEAARNRVFFYSGDREEPPHVYVERESMVAKFWLSPVRLQRSAGFGRAELRRVGRLIETHADELLERWDDFFAD